MVFGSLEVARNSRALAFVYLHTLDPILFAAGQRTGPIFDDS